MKWNILATMTLAAVFVPCVHIETGIHVTRIREGGRMGSHQMPYKKVNMLKAGTPFGNTFAALVFTGQPYSNFPTYTR